MQWRWSELHVHSWNKFTASTQLHECDFFMPVNQNKKTTQDQKTQTTHPKIKLETLFPVCQKTAQKLICSTVFLVSPGNPCPTWCKTWALTETAAEPQRLQPDRLYVRVCMYAMVPVLALTASVPPKSYRKLLSLDHALSWEAPPFGGHTTSPRLRNGRALKISWVWTPAYQETLA